MDTIVEGDARAARVPSCSMPVVRAGTAGRVILVAEDGSQRIVAGRRDADRSEAAPQIRDTSSA
ncbi:hypothetical protein [Caballeronia sordidicola]|uniref:Uncharacterized protein n=1 Tax=Caballeronia sordidicola TaxID=196367 RepID=A0A226WQC0_CABSO|nr:hypothetical protein [Caballeronia sordidicola]OXC72828.1 hypothetical protein BSU04_39970 [Caballeronia sordidicola]